MSAIKAKCRYCGTRVSYFGEVCADCKGDSTEEEMMELNESNSFLRDLGRIES